MNLAMFIVNVLSCIAWATVAFAQGDPPYPSRTVRLVVATTAGTTADVLARVLADRTSVLWRQSVVVENRPGVAGITSVASASPDGHALLVTANGHAAVGALHKDLPLDPVKDLVGAAQIGHVPLVLVVPLELPVQNLRDLISFAKARPGAVNFASAGLGSTSHLAGEVFKRAADVNIQHVPYRGAESLTSIMRSDTQMTIIPVSTALDLINSKKLRAIAVISPERIPSLPEVPTFSRIWAFRFHVQRLVRSASPRKHAEEHPRGNWPGHRKRFKAVGYPGSSHATGCEHSILAIGRFRQSHESGC